MLNFSLTAAVILSIIVGGVLSHSLAHQSMATPQSPDKTQQQNKSQNRTKKNPTAPNEMEQVLDTNAIERQRHTFAISLITTLANEARSYKDIELRARVLARSADALWDSDAEIAQTLFRRAWEAAQNANAEDTPSPGVPRNATPVMSTVLRRSGDGDLRSEVLNLAPLRKSHVIGTTYWKPCSNWSIGPIHVTELHPLSDCYCNRPILIFRNFLH